MTKQRHNKAEVAVFWFSYLAGTQRVHFSACRWRSISRRPSGLQLSVMCTRPGITRQ